MGTESMFPGQVIMMDPEMIEFGHKDKVFYLRVEVSPHRIDLVDLDGALTVTAARRIAREKGYDPKYWMKVGDARVQSLY